MNKLLKSLALPAFFICAVWLGSIGAEIEERERIERARAYEITKQIMLERQQILQPKRKCLLWDASDMAGMIKRDILPQIEELERAKKDG